MKKIIIILLLIAVSAVMYISLFIQNNMTIDEKIEKVLGEAYNNNYKSYAEAFDYEKIENKRLKEVESLFTEKGFNFIKRMSFMTESVRFIKKYRCNTSIESFNLDIRETSDINNKVCYYSIDVKIEFLDEIDETMFIELNGSISLYLENDVWLIGIILEDQYLFPNLDLDKLSD